MTMIVRILKVALFTVNFVIISCGICSLLTGVWVLTDLSFMKELLGISLYVSSATIMIVTGVLMVVISFLGCVGVIKEIKNLLLTYFATLFVMFAITLTGGILRHAFKLDMQTQMFKGLVSSIYRYNADTFVTEAWDSLQEDWECCGILTQNIRPGWKIWSKLSNKRFSYKKVPKSCCKKNEIQFTTNCQNDPGETTVHLDDCYTLLKDFLEDHSLILLKIFIGTECILILGMILSGLLYVVIKRIRCRQIKTEHQNGQVILNSNVSLFGDYVTRAVPSQIAQAPIAINEPNPEVHPAENNRSIH